MLNRVRGGAKGIKDYLVSGRKVGRAFTRDELDERVVLSGDLDLTDSIIENMTNEGECYLHITFSFREDNVDVEILQQCIDEFTQFAFASYEKDEYNLYAEAHLPKISSYVNEHDGKNVIRKPHIHIVIPELNLLSGHRLNPFGYVTHQNRYLQAFQETMNAKFGLASPLDLRRIKITDGSSAISQYEGDIFKGANQLVKRNLLKKVLENRIESYKDFVDMLSNEGKVKTVGSCAFGEYLNLKPGGHAKGLNLKEYVFSREFIEKPFREKIKLLTNDDSVTSNKYEGRGIPRRVDALFEERLDEWHGIRAAEIKYINSGNRKLYGAYRSASRETKLSMLADMAGHFYSKYKKDIDHDGAQHQQSHINGLGHKPPAAARGRMRSLSELNVVNIAGRGEMLLPNHVLGELEHDRAEPDNKLRRANDCVIDQLIYEKKSSREQVVAENKKDISEIKKNIDATRLLAHLSQTHGEIPEKYTITQGKDGSDRIQCGTRNWNASDFLTKERHLPWGDAEVILRAVYASQLKEEVPQRRHTPRKELWNKYRNEWKPREKARSAAAWTTQKDSQKKRRATLKAEYRDEKSRLYASSLGKLERKTALSLALINKVMDETVLREQIRNERLVLKSLYQKSAATQYREFLAEQAQKGDELALAELRRQSPAPHQAEDRTPEIRLGNSDSLAATDDAAAPLLKRDLRYSVSGNGNVTYHDEYGTALFQDCWRAVRLYQDDAKTIETGLRLAQQKFGSKLSLNGSDEFKRRAVEVAVYSGIKVKFNDEKLNEYAFEYAAAIETKVNPERRFPDEALARFRRNIGDEDIPDESIKRVGHKVK